MGTYQGSGIYSESELPILTQGTRKPGYGASNEAPSGITSDAHMHTDLHGNMQMGLHTGSSVVQARHGSSHYAGVSKAQRKNVTRCDVDDDYDYRSPHVRDTLAYKLDKFFKVTQRGSTVWTEIRSGLVTFFTMVYILVLNAQILHLASRDPHTSMPFTSVATATALSSAIASGLTGYLGNLPFGLAPGMGINSYFTYGICLRLGLSWQIGLTCSFFTGVLFFILSVSGACTLIQKYSPMCVKKGITVGLGLFQALIGFEMMRLVVTGEETLLTMGNVGDPSVILSMLGVVFICALMILRVQGAMIVGLAFITITSWVLGLQAPPSAIFSMPTLEGTFFQLDFAGYFTHASQTVPITLIILFVAVFDTAGVHYALGHQADLLDKETDALPGATGAFTAASIASMVGACIGTSPVIIHNESTAGIADGGKTGLNAMVVSIGFICSLPFVPILAAVPSFASSSPLIVVGVLMMSAANYIKWSQFEEALPAFLTITLLPLTYSIANGMVAGMLSYAILKPVAMIAESRKDNCEYEEVGQHDHHHHHGHGHSHSHSHQHAVEHVLVDGAATYH